MFFAGYVRKSAFAHPTPAAALALASALHYHSTGTNFEQGGRKWPSSASDKLCGEWKTNAS